MIGNIVDDLKGFKGIVGASAVEAIIMISYRARALYSEVAAGDDGEGGGGEGLKGEGAEQTKGVRRMHAAPPPPHHPGRPACVLVP